MLAVVVVDQLVGDVRGRNAGNGPGRRFSRAIPVSGGIRGLGLVPLEVDLAPAGQVGRHPRLIVDPELDADDDRLSLRELSFQKVFFWIFEKLVSKWNHTCEIAY